MKCLFWKCCILFIALALLLALGAFAEGTFGLPLTAACCPGGLSQYAGRLGRGTARRKPRRHAPRPPHRPQPVPAARTPPKPGAPSPSGPPEWVSLRCAPSQGPAGPPLSQTPAGRPSALHKALLLLRHSLLPRRAVKYETPRLPLCCAQ